MVTKRASCGQNGAVGNHGSPSFRRGWTRNRAKTWRTATAAAPGTFHRWCRQDFWAPQYRSTWSWESPFPVSNKLRLNYTRNWTRKFNPYTVLFSVHRKEVIQNWVKFYKNSDSYTKTIFYCNILSNRTQQNTIPYSTTITIRFSLILYKIVYLQLCKTVLIPILKHPLSRLIRGARGFNSSNSRRLQHYRAIRVINVLYKIGNNSHIFW